jgi:trimeric autotransporter adhesin
MSWLKLVDIQNVQNALFTVPNVGPVGNARGTQALDFQSSRYAATEVASGAYAVAVGVRCLASGANSSAMGRSAFTAAASAVANGLLVNQTGGTLNHGTGAIAGNPGATTSGVLSVAKGIYCNAAGANSVVLGRNCFSTAAATSAVAVGVMNNFNGGTIDDITGVIAGPVTAAATVGINSTAVGVSNKAAGLRATAVGFKSTASAPNAVAVGYLCSATLNSACAVGRLVTASATSAVAVGSNANAQATDSVVFGRACTVIAGGTNGLAMGRSCFGSATSITSVAIGTLINQQTATLDHNTGTIAGVSAAAANIGINSVCVGLYNTASGTNAVVVGRNNFTSATAVSAVSIGLLNNQTGGGLTISTGAITGSPASTTTGISSIAIGTMNVASAVGCGAIGRSNTIDSASQYSFAMGNGVTISAAVAAIGVGRQIGVAAANCVLFGSRAFTSATSLSSVAMGAMVNQIGSTFDQNTGVITGAAPTGTTTGLISVCVGIYSNARAKNAVVVGRNSFVESTGVSAVAVGLMLNQVTGTMDQDTGVLGNVPAFDPATTGIASICMGVFSTARAKNSVVIGRGCFSSAAGTSTISLGILCNQSGGAIDPTTGVISGTPVPATSGINSLAVGIRCDCAGLRAIAIGYNNTSAGGSGMSVGTVNVCSSPSGMAIGHGNQATTQNNAIAIGRSNLIGSLSGIGIGSGCGVAAGGTNVLLIGRSCFGSATSVSAVSIGILVNQTGGTIDATTGIIGGVAPASTTTGINSVAVGVSANANALRSVCLGFNVLTQGTDSVAIGVSVIAAALRSSAIGIGSNARIQDTTVLQPPIIAPKTSGVVQSDAVRKLSGVQDIFYSVEVDLTAVADYTFVLPAGSVFFVDEVGVISTQVGGAVTLEPTCRWGIVGTLAKYKAATLLTLLTAANKRERFQTLLADDGETSANSLSAGVTVGGTVAAGVYKGRFYFKGHFVEAEP